MGDSLLYFNLDSSSLKEETLTQTLASSARASKTPLSASSVGVGVRKGNPERDIFDCHQTRKDQDGGEGESSSYKQLMSESANMEFWEI